MVFVFVAVADRIARQDLAADLGPSDLHILEVDCRIQQDLLELAISKGNSRRFAVSKPIEPTGGHKEKQKQRTTTQPGTSTFFASLLHRPNLP